MKFLEWPSWSLDLNPSEMLWHDSHAAELKKIKILHLSQMIDFRSSCQGCHNQLLSLVFHSEPGLNSFFPLIDDIIFYKLHSLFLLVISV